MKKKFISRIAAFAAASVLVLGLGLMSVGCSQQEAAPEPDTQDPTALITEQLTEGFDFVKSQFTSLDSATINSMFDSGTLKQFESMGLDGAEFVKAMFDGFDYEIGDITVNGDTAQAAVTMKMKDLSEWMTAIEEGAVQIALNNPNITQDEMMKQMGPMMLDALNNVKGMADIPITVEATNVNGEWTIDSDTLSNEVANAMMSSLTASE